MVFHETDAIDETEFVFVPMEDTQFETEIINRNSRKHFQFGCKTFGPPKSSTEVLSDYFKNDVIKEFQNSVLCFKKTLKVSDLIDNLLLFDSDMNICQPVVNYHNIQEKHKIFKNLLEFCKDSSNNNWGTKSWEIDIVSFLVSDDMSAIDNQHVWEPVRCVHDNSHWHIEGRKTFATLNCFEDMVEFKNMVENRMLHHDNSHYFGIMDGLHRITALLKQNKVLSDKMKNADIIVNFYGAKRVAVLSRVITFDSCQDHSRSSSFRNKAFIEENIHDQIVQVWNSVDKLQLGDGKTDTVNPHSMIISFQNPIWTGIRNVFASSQNKTVSASSQNKKQLQDIGKGHGDDFISLTKHLVSKAHITSYFMKSTKSTEFDDHLPFTCIFCLILAVYVHTDVGEKIKSNLKKLGKDFRQIHIFYLVTLSITYATIVCPKRSKIGSNQWVLYLYPLILSDILEATVNFHLSSPECIRRGRSKYSSIGKKYTSASIGDDSKKDSDNSVLSDGDDSKKDSDNSVISDGNDNQDQNTGNGLDALRIEHSDWKHELDIVLHQYLTYLRMIFNQDDKESNVDKERKVTSWLTPHVVANVTGHSDLFQDLKGHGVHSYLFKGLVDKLWISKDHFVPISFGAFIESSLSDEANHKNLAPKWSMGTFIDFTKLPRRTAILIPSKSLQGKPKEDRALAAAFFHLGISQKVPKSKHGWVDAMINAPFVIQLKDFSAKDTNDYICFIGSDPDGSPVAYRKDDKHVDCWVKRKSFSEIYILSTLQMLEGILESSTEVFALASSVPLDSSESNGVACCYVSLNRVFEPVVAPAQGTALATVTATVPHAIASKNISSSESKPAASTPDGTNLVIKCADTNPSETSRPVQIQKNASPSAIETVTSPASLQKSPDTSSRATPATSPASPQATSPASPSPLPASSPPASSSLSSSSSSSSSSLSSSSSSPPEQSPSQKSRQKPSTASSASAPPPPLPKLSCKKRKRDSTPVSTRNGNESPDPTDDPMDLKALSLDFPTDCTITCGLVEKVSLSFPGILTVMEEDTYSDSSNQSMIVKVNSRILCESQTLDDYGTLEKIIGLLSHCPFVHLIFTDLPPIPFKDTFSKLSGLRVLSVYIVGSRNETHCQDLCSMRSRDFEEYCSLRTSQNSHCRAFINLQITEKQSTEKASKTSPFSDDSNTDSPHYDWRLDKESPHIVINIADDILYSPDENSGETMRPLQVENLVKDLPSFLKKTLPHQEFCMSKELQNDSRASLGPNIMCGPKGASTSLHWDGRCGDISAVHINLKGINQVLIFPRQQDTQQAEDIFNLMYHHKCSANDALEYDGSVVFQSPKNRSEVYQWPDLDYERKKHLETKYGMQTITLEPMQALLIGSGQLHTFRRNQEGTPMHWSIAWDFVNCAAVPDEYHTQVLSHSILYAMDQHTKSLVLPLSVKCPEDITLIRQIIVEAVTAQCSIPDHYVLPFLQIVREEIRSVRCLEKISSKIPEVSIPEVSIFHGTQKISDAYGKHNCSECSRLICNTVLVRKNTKDVYLCHLCYLQISPPRTKKSLFSNTKKKEDLRKGYKVEMQFMSLSFMKDMVVALQQKYFGEAQVQNISIADVVIKEMGKTLSLFSSVHDISSK